MSELVVPLKIFGYVVVLLVRLAMLYSAHISITYWSGKAVYKVRHEQEASPCICHWFHSGGDSHFIGLTVDNHRQLGKFTSVH